MVIDDHATACGDVQAAAPAQCILWADTGGEHDQVGFQVLTTVEVHAVAVGFTGTDRLGGARQVHPHTQRFDLRLQRGTALAVQLYRHQPWGEFHHVGFQPQRLESVGRFQAKQATADHHPPAGTACGSTNAIEVVQGAVDQAGIAAGAFDRRHEGIGAGGQHQLVVAIATFGSDNFAALTVDLQHGLTQVQVHAIGVVEIVLTQGQGFGTAAAEVFGQVHAVIRALALFAEYPHLEALQGAATDQLFDAMVADHAVADDDQSLSLPAARCCLHKPILDQKKTPGAEAPGAFACIHHGRGPG
ncbi:hypothetical protein D3C76_445470 [compost metagenome]